MNATHRLRWLLWIAALIGCWVLLLDWSDEHDQLRSEAQAARAQRNRELGTLEGANWAAEASRARSAQLEWLGRFIEAETPGLMRVTALEKVKKLCDEARAACQISLLGDEADTAAPTRPAASQRAAERPGGQLPSGTQAVKVKLGFDFSPAALLRLLQRIEAADPLYAVDRLQISGPRAEIQLVVFFVDASEARRIRSSAAAQADPGTGS